MGQFSKWLLHEDQKELFDYLWANVLTLLFLAVVALLLWPLGRFSTALSLAKGYWVFWNAAFMSMMLLLLFRRLFRVDIDDRYDAYVISALLVGGLLQAGWSAFAAITVGGAAAGAPLWLAATLYLVGLLSCWVAFGIVSAFFMGSIYRLVNLPLAAATFVLFSLWPSGGRAIFGWFFDLAWRFYAMLGRFLGLT